MCAEGRTQYEKHAIILYIVLPSSLPLHLATPLMNIVVLDKYAVT